MNSPSFADELLGYDAEVAAELGHELPPDADKAAVEAHLDWQLQQVGDIEAQIAGNNEVAKRRIAMVTDWRDSENAVLERRIAYIRNRIQQHALAFDFNGKRSRRLPSGEFGTRRTPDSIDITDKAKALEFARSHQVAVKVTEEVQKKPLLEWVNSTGLEPDVERDGFAVSRGADQFYIKTTKDS